MYSAKYNWNANSVYFNIQCLQTYAKNLKLKEPACAGAAFGALADWRQEVVGK